MADSPLVLGPTPRYVDETFRRIWVESASVVSGQRARRGRSWDVPTFAVRHHYALVEVEGLARRWSGRTRCGSDGTTVRPEPDPLSAPVIRRARPASLRMAFGSCRTSVSDDRSGNRTHGSTRCAVALAVAAGGESDPICCCSSATRCTRTRRQEMQEFIRARRTSARNRARSSRITRMAHLYQLAWTGSRATGRCFCVREDRDDLRSRPDIRDDWKPRRSTGRRRWRRPPGGRDSFVAAPGSYWVYQHLGNLSPRERARGRVVERIRGHDGTGELDLTDVLDDFANRSTEDPGTYRWNVPQDYDDVRLIVVHWRVSRELDRRSAG